MTSWYDSRTTRPPWRESELNRETTRKYVECGGNHVPSGQWLERDWKGSQAAFWVCVRCGVPQLSGRSPSWWTSRGTAA